MNDNKEQQKVYCMTCNKIVEISKTMNVMRTCFYLLIYPLASNCIECRDYQIPDNYM